MSSFAMFVQRWLAFGISILSLLASIWSGWASYEAYTTNKLLYRPYAITTTQFDDTGKKHGIYLANAGLSPAIIRDMSVVVGGRRYSGLGTSIWPRLVADMGLSAEPCFRTGWPLPESVMKAGDEVPLFVVSGVAPADCKMRMLGLLISQDIVVEIQYASMYGDEYSFAQSMRLNTFDPALAGRPRKK